MMSNTAHWYAWTRLFLSAPPGAVPGTSTSASTEKEPWEALCGGFMVSSQKAHFPDELSEVHTPAFPYYHREKQPGKRKIGSGSGS